MAMDNDVTIKYSPCVYCESRAKCQVMCPTWQEWFRESWHIVTEQLKKEKGE